MASIAQKPAFCRIVAVACLCAAGGVSHAAAQTVSPQSAPADARPHVAIAGFVRDASSDPRDTWVPVAIEETLAWRLGRVPALITVPTVRTYEAWRELREDPAASPEWRRTVRLLGAEVLLSGTCSGPPDAIVLQLTLLPTADKAGARASTTIPTGRLFGVLDAATNWVLQQLGVQELSEDIQRLIYAPPARSPSAVEYYAKAILAIRQGQLLDTRHYASEATSYDKQYRPAILLLAQVEPQLVPQARTLAVTRLRLLAELARMHDDPVDRAAALLAQALILRPAETDTAALRRIEESLSSAYESREPYGQLAAMNGICDLYLTSTAPDDATWSEARRQRFRESNLRHAVEWQKVVLAMLENLGDTVAEIPAASKLALIYERLGEDNQALALHQRTLQAARLTETRHMQATTWMFIGQWYNRHERWQEALDALSRCLTLAEGESKAAVRVALANVYQSMGLLEDALGQYDLAYEQIRDGENLGDQFLCLRELSKLRMQLGQRDQAILALQEAIDIAHVLELRVEEDLRTQLDEWQHNRP
ncbi:MAG: tetratricopeptide repeat protein [Planctomycetes bacterium]|nr:tetratricopeptide repeat protein [Planctomycetota bacterium]